VTDLLRRALRQIDAAFSPVSAPFGDYYRSLGRR